MDIQHGELYALVRHAEQSKSPGSDLMLAIAKHLPEGMDPEGVTFKAFEGRNGVWVMQLVWDELVYFKVPTGWLVPLPEIRATQFVQFVCRQIEVLDTGVKVLYGYMERGGSRELTLTSFSLPADVKELLLYWVDSGNWALEDMSGITYEEVLII